MTLQAKDGILTIHTRSIIGHSDQLTPPSGEFHSDSAGSGINAVFNKFFDNGSWALDHLAGGDLAGNLICKQSNLSHAI
jgi:hypothetical protein